MTDYKKKKKITKNYTKSQNYKITIIMTDYEASSSETNKKYNQPSLPLSPSFVCSISTGGHRCCCKRSFAGDDRVASKPSEMRRRIFFFKYIYLFIYLFLATLGLHCCARAFCSCSERGLLFIAVRGLLIAVASLVAEHGTQRVLASVVVARGLSSCGT